MHHRLRAAIAAAHAAFAPARGPVVQHITLPTRQTAQPSVRRRIAGETAITLRPVSVTPPEHETDLTIQQFVRDEFAEAQRKRKTRAA